MTQDYSIADARKFIFEGIKGRLDKKTLGLVGMKERAVMFNGELIVEGSKDQGTIITLKIPLVP